MFELEEEIKKKLLEGMLSNSPQLGGPAMIEGGGTPGELYQEDLRQQQVAQAEQNARNNVGLGQTLTEDLVGSLTAGPGIGQLAGLLANPVGDAEALIGGAAAVKGLDKIYDAAKQLKLGKGRDEVFQGTGIYAGPLDDGLRAIISDEKAVLKGLPRAGESKKLSEVLDHPELFKAYPDLKDVRVDGEEMARGSKASYNSQGDFIRVNTRDDPAGLDSLLHEIQHGIQQREGFIPGTNINAMKKSAKFAEGISDPQTLGQLLEIKRSEGLQQSLADILAEKLYRLVGGEAEARAVQEQLKRGDWKSLPTDLYDVPYDQVIKPR